MTTPSTAQSSSNQLCVAALLRRCLTVRPQRSPPVFRYSFRPSNHDSVSFYSAVINAPTMSTESVAQSISNQ